MQPNIFYENNFGFILNDDFTATLIDINQTTVNCIIPGEIQNDGNTYTVVKIGTYNDDEPRDGLQKIQFLTFPSTVKCISSRSFQLCGLLKIVNFNSNKSASLDVIDDYAFSTCKNLKKISLPSSIKRIGKYAFSSCHQLDTVEFWSDNSKLEIIDKGAFSSCTSISSITIVSSVKCIGKKAFENCSLLKKVIFETDENQNSSLESIEENAFLNCVALKSIEIPKNVKKVASGAFAKSGIEFLSFPSEIQQPNGFCQSMSCLVRVTMYPSTQNRFRLTSDSILYEKKNELDEEITLIFAPRNIVNARIPSNVKQIGSNAFAECSLLHNVTFLKNSNGVCAIQSIDIEAFKSCNNLQSILIPSSLQVIFPYAFMNCTQLHEVKFEPGSNMEIIGDYSFQSCANLEQISIPPRVKSIKSNAFSYCTQLKSLVFEKNEDTLSIKEIDNFAFEYCSLLTSFLIPSTIQTLGIGVFSKCKNLQWIEFQSPNENLTVIPRQAFDTCIKLKQITIPKSIKVIEENAFQNCGIQYLKFETDINNNASIEELKPEAFLNCNRLVSLIIPSSMQLINQNCFQDCRNLRYLEIQGSKTIIHPKAFSSCKNLICVSIPKPKSNNFPQQFQKATKSVFYLSC